MNYKPTTEDKVVLLLALVPYLLSNGATPINEIAERFSVPASEVRKIAAYLGTAGIPGETFTYQDQDMFDINWMALEEDDVLELVTAIAVDDTPKFSGVETAALLAGLQLLTGVLPDNFKKTAADLQVKLAAATQDFNITVTQEDMFSVPHNLDLFTESILSLEQLSITYVARDGNESSRTVDPLALKQIGNFWYLQAYCHLRQDKRIFRLEGIINARVNGKKFSADQKLLITDGFNFENELSVTIAVHESALHQLEPWAPKVLGVHSNGVLKAEVLLAHEANVINLVLSAPARVEVIEPESIREFVSTWLNDTVALFR